MKKNEDNPILLQVHTGEGKSIIVATLAILYSLNRKKVNIVTSSPVLAERDSNYNKNLYSMFWFSTSHNADEKEYTSGPKRCYKFDIIYGDAAQY